MEFLTNYDTKLPAARSVFMIAKLMIKNYVLIKRLYYAFFMSLFNRLQKTVKVFLFLLCFSTSFNISNNSKIGIELFYAAFCEEAAISREQSAKAVWKIKIGQNIGSGFFISTNKIVTNFHVIKHAESIGLENIILAQEGHSEQLKVKRILSLSIIDDLALLEVDGAVSDFLSLPSVPSLEDLLNSSKNLYILGYPEGKFQEIRQTGAFTEYSFFGNHSNAGGASGSPVLNDSHQLVGVLDRVDINFLFFISIKKLRSFIVDKYFSCKSLSFKECFRSSRETLIKSIQEVKEGRDYFGIAMYYKREGGGRNLSQSIKWLEKSSAKGYILAQQDLALRYYKGEGVEQDWHLSRKLLKKLAEQGYARAQYELANMYYYGEGGGRDLSKARKWMQKAAEQGYAPAQYELANMYYYGEGGGRDLSKARKWMQKAAEQGYVWAQYGLSRMYYYGEGGGRDLSKARKWMQKAAEQGYAPAQYELANMYYYGEGGGRDLSKARKWMQKAAEQGYVWAQYGLSRMYYYGEGGGRDLSKARKWMKKAAEQGDAQSQHGLALMYYYGEGGKKNLLLAIELLEESARQGYAPAKRDLALIYYYGEGGKKNLLLVIELLEESAGQGYAPAKHDLDMIYHKDKKEKKGLIQTNKKCINTFED